MRTIPTSNIRHYHTRKYPEECVGQNQNAFSILRIDLVTPVSASRLETAFLLRFRLCSFSTHALDTLSPIFDDMIPGFGKVVLRSQ